MTVISPEKTHNLTPEQVASYEDHGCLHIERAHDRRSGVSARRGARPAEAPPRCRHRGHELQRLGQRQDVADGPLKLYHCHNVQFQSAASARVIVDPRLTGRIADRVGRTRNAQRDPSGGIGARTIQGVGGPQSRRSAVR